STGERLSAPRSYLGARRSHPGSATSQKGFHQHQMVVGKVPEGNSRIPFAICRKATRSSQTAKGSGRITEAIPRLTDVSHFIQ
ncbi:MAG TPA: hypothetical protein VN843_10045, partial [Anaerolineales bacterium]|nr:hypothetical protein [Anaerolineales bacterium]